MGAHTVKFGFRWAREIGFKSNPQTNRFTFTNLDDLLANKASDFLLAMGNPPHQSVGRPVRRASSRTTGASPNGSCSTWVCATTTIRGLATGPRMPSDPAEVNNLNNPTDIRKMDFGAPRALDNAD